MELMERSKFLLFLNSAIGSANRTTPGDVILPSYRRKLRVNLRKELKKLGLPSDAETVGCAATLLERMRTDSGMEFLVMRYLEEKIWELYQKKNT
jgi:hypothetical protein